MNDGENHKPGGSARPFSSPGELEDMLRRLAHELRTPLAAIASRAELIRNEQFGPLGDAHYLTYAETIENSANLALQVLERAIQEIVTSAGEPTDSMVATNLSQTLAEVVDMVEPVATDFGVKIQQDRVDPDCWATTSPLYLKQILINLFSNAIKFTPLGGVVTVSLVNEADRGSVIEVKDGGLGIAPAELARLKGSVDDRKHGYGIINELRRRCGGELEIESARGRGTRVSLSLPAAEAAP